MMEAANENEGVNPDLQRFLKMRSSMNNSNVKRQQSQSVVVFNGNPAINEFKRSIPELKIKRGDIDFADHFEPQRDES